MKWRILGLSPVIFRLLPSNCNIIALPLADNYVVYESLCLAFGSILPLFPNENTHPLRRCSPCHSTNHGCSHSPIRQTTSINHVTLPTPLTIFTPSCISVCCSMMSPWQGCTSNTANPIMKRPEEINPRQPKQSNDNGLTRSTRNRKGRLTGPAQGRDGLGIRSVERLVGNPGGRPGHHHGGVMG